VTVTFTGLEGMYRRVDERHNDDTERKKYLEDQVREYIPVGSSWNLPTSRIGRALRSPLWQEFNVKIPAGYPAQDAGHCCR